MNTLNQLKFRYSGGVKMLFAVMLLTFLNCVIALFGGGFFFLFTAMFPYYAAGSFTGIPQVLFAALPVALLLVCWLLARKEKYGWMIAALVLLLLDTAFMIWLFTQKQYSTGIIIINSLTHGLALLSLFNASRAGHRLANGIYPPVEGILPTGDNDDTPITPRKFYYDINYAKAHNATKGVKGVVALFLLLGLLIGGAVFFTLIADYVSGWVVRYGMIGSLASSLIIPYILMHDVSTFDMAKSYSFHVRKKGVLEREGVNGSEMNHLEMTNIKLIKKKPDRWIIEYDLNGRRSRLTIPNAYPGLEEFMEEYQEQTV